MTPVKHLPFQGPYESNLPQGAKALLNALFAKQEEGLTSGGGGEYVFGWTWSGMAYGFAEAWSVGDLEEFVYCLDEEIKRRQE